MVHTNYWERGAKKQWIFCANDNSALDGLQEKVNIDILLYSADDEPVNLGIKRINGRVYSGNYVGLCKLKDLYGRSIISNDGCEVVLKIEPRFNVSVVDMLQMLKDDDEFERYLAPQTTRIGERSKEIDDLKCNELFYFFDSEDPIYVTDHVALNSSIITASVFLSLLKDLCSRPLMGKMLCKEENLVGKIKGKVLFKKNIRLNTLRGRDDRVFCKYLQYSEDIIENQILKVALQKVERFLNKFFGSASGTRNTFKEMVTYCHNALAHISSTKILRQDLSQIKTTGCYIHYKPVINVAKMVLNEITIEATGETMFTSYVVPYAVSMNKLFEVYVRAYLKKAGIKSFHYQDHQIRMLEFDYKAKVLSQSGNNYSMYIKGNIKPDIILYNPINNKYLVLDVKYKNILTNRNSRDDRLQVLAYSLIYDCEHVGIVFPSVEAGRNVYYEKNEIQSVEEKVRYFDQIELTIDVDASFQIFSKQNNLENNIYGYLENLLQ